LWACDISGGQDEMWFELVLLLMGFLAGTYRNEILIIFKKELKKEKKK
jgi:hypothetical protein